MGGVWFSFFWKKDVAKAQTPFASSFSFLTFYFIYFHLKILGC